MSASLPDIIIRERDRNLRVCAEWSTEGKAWAVSVEDNTFGRSFADKRVGDYVIGQTAVWCHTRDDAMKAQARAANDARTRRIR